MPFELRPYPTPTLRPEGSYLQSAWAHSVYPIAARMGIDIRLPDVSPQPYTRSAHEGLEFAKDHGVGDTYNSGVMRAFFQHGEDIGRIDVLTRIASEAGLDSEPFREALSSRSYADRVAELLRHAYDDVQVTGVPLFLIGETRLSGVQPREKLALILDRHLNAE